MSNKAFLSFFAVLSLIAFGSGYWMESRALDKHRQIVEKPPFVDEYLYAYFPLNGDPTDASGGGNDGTLSGPPKFVEDRFGVAQAACHFDGSSDRITFDKNKTMEIQDPNTFTVSFWIKKDEKLTGTVIQLFGDVLEEEGGVPPVEGYFEVRNYKGEKAIFLQWLISGRGGSDGTGTLEAILDSANGGWNFVAVVFKEDGKDGEPKMLLATMYINGEKNTDVQNPKSTALFTETEKMKKEFILGRQSKAVPAFRGVLDDVRVYSVSLDPFHINGLYKYEKYRE
jgi:hypothetical protein